MDTQSDQEISGAYLSGDTLLKIAEDRSVCAATVWNSLRRSGTPIRPHRKYTLNQSAFDTITEESAYWIGFLMADGCIKEVKRTPYVQLEITESDKGHIESFLGFLGSSQPIKIEKNNNPKAYSGSKPLASVRVCSQQLASSLARYGVVPRKSKSARVIGLENDRHFWRGMVDGDGWLQVNRIAKISLTGGQGIVDQFAAFAAEKANAKSGMYPNHSIMNAVITGHAAERMIHLLYDNCTVALPRKLAIANAVWLRRNRLGSRWNGKEVIVQPGPSPL